MKKGFTLIEIIISIVLIIAVGTTSTIILLNTNNKNEEIENITKQILEAANAFISVEKDEFGNTYKNGISRGGKGVQLSVQNLIDKGYLEDNQITTLEKYTDLDSTELYILAAITVLNESECGENVIEYTASWYEDSEDPIYLCGYKSNEGNGPGLDCSPTFMYNIFYRYYDKAYSLDDEEFTDFYWTQAASSESYTYIPKYSGLFKDAQGILYYRGDITNNYVKLNNEIFRIAYIYYDTLALIKEKAIDSSYYTNATATDPSTFEGSKIKSAIDTWYEDFVTSVATDVNIDKNLLFTYSLENPNTKVDLLDAYEIKFAGIITGAGSQRYTSSCFYSIDGGKYDNESCIGFDVTTSWLNTGDSFIERPYRGDNQSYYYSVMNVVDSGYKYLGFYNDGIKPGNRGKIEKGLRPVIFIDGIKTQYTGTGTLQDPYTIYGTTNEYNSCFE